MTPKPEIVIEQPPVFDPYWYGSDYGLYDDATWPGYFSPGWQPSGYSRGYAQGAYHSHPALLGPRYPGPTGHMGYSGHIGGGAHSGMGNAHSGHGGGHR